MTVVQLPAPSGDLVLNPKDPMPAARAFVDAHHHLDGRRVLHHHRGTWRAWDGACYPAIEEAEIRAELWGFLDGAQRRGKGKRPVPYQPNRARVSDVLDALRAACNLPADVDPPAWLVGLAAPPPAPRPKVARSDPPPWPRPRVLVRRAGRAKADVQIQTSAVALARPSRNSDEVRAEPEAVA